MSDAGREAFEAFFGGVASTANFFMGAGVVIFLVLIIILVLKGKEDISESNETERAVTDFWITILRGIGLLFLFAVLFTAT